MMVCSFDFGLVALNLQGVGREYRAPPSVYLKNGSCCLSRLVRFKCSNFNVQSVCLFTK